MGVLAFALGLSALASGGIGIHQTGQRVEAAPASSNDQHLEKVMYRGLQKKSDYTILKEIDHDPEAFT